jgi:hypothetical protein
MCVCAVVRYLCDCCTVSHVQPGCGLASVQVFAPSPSPVPLTSAVIHCFSKPSLLSLPTHPLQPRTSTLLLALCAQSQVCACSRQPPLAHRLIPSTPPCMTAGECVWRAGYCQGVLQVYAGQLQVARRPKRHAPAPAHDQALVYPSIPRVCGHECLCIRRGGESVPAVPPPCHWVSLFPHLPPLPPPPSGLDVRLGWCCRSMVWSSSGPKMVPL